jgi:hypothetical protein
MAAALARLRLERFNPGLGRPVDGRAMQYVHACTHACSHDVCWIDWTFGCFSCRWHQTHSSKHKRSGSGSEPPSPDAPLEPSEYDDIIPLVDPTPPRVALLILSEDGTVRSSQANLAAAVTRRLPHVHVRTFTYGMHKDKGDSLLVFDQAGVALQASFLSTAVFRDGFNAI